MRIVTGSLKGRRIVAPPNLPVRPTTDMAKEALFNVLNNWIEFDELRVLDLFAGTGNISFEFVSRGVKELVAVELNFKCVSFIKETVDRLGIGNMKVYRADVLSFLQNPRQSFDIIFADPPYDLEELNEIPDKVFKSNVLNPGGILILEHSKSNDFENHQFFYDKRNYGKVNFSFFSHDKGK